MSTDGANIVWQEQNKNLFFFQIWQHTSVEGNTNVQFVAKLVGYKAEGHRQKVFIKKIQTKEIFMVKKLRDKLLSICVIFFSVTTEKQ